jgi:putative two-component system response regulator
MWIPPTHTSERAPLTGARIHAPDDDSALGQILIVDDSREAGAAQADLLRLAGYMVELVADGRAALQAVEQHQPDLIILDVRLPGIDGFAVCDALKRNPATWQIPIIMVTVEGELRARLQGIEAGADDYLQKPADQQELEARIRALLRTKRRNDQLEQAEAVIFALARAVEAKDSYTKGHLQRLASYAVAIGERLGLSGEALVALRHGALLHDVGKVGVDELIIRKGGPLTPAEYRVMQQHTLIGERIVQPLRMAAAVGPIVRYHHERWDGRGYPDGLAREAIPLCARIVAVADAFDAMTSARPYNRVLSDDEAADRLRAGAGIFWDPAVVQVFLECLPTIRRYDDSDNELSVRTLQSRSVGELGGELLDEARHG